MPIWPFGSSHSDETPEAIVERSPLGPITDATPHRFRIRVADADAALARAALDGLGAELTATAEGGPDGHGVPLDIASTFSPRTAAILRPLNRLSRAGVRVTGFEALDVVTDLDDDALAAGVAAWGTYANRGPHRHRLEVLAGAPMLERCLAGMQRSDQGDPRRTAAWRFAAGCVAFNTDGVEERMVDAALTAGADHAPSLLDPVIQRAEVARLTGGILPMREEGLAALIRRPDYVSERAAYLAALLPNPLPQTVIDALCDAAVRGGEASEQAIATLANAPQTQRVRQTLRRVEGSEPSGPTIERDGDAWLVTFDDATAHSSERERFEELAEASSAVAVVDSDREWVRVRIDGEGEVVVRELWERATR